MLLSVSLGASAIKLSGPPTRAMLAGSWVGAEQLGAVLRLDVDAQGKGRLIESDRDGSRSTYSVALTRIDGYKLTFSVAFAGNSGSTFKLTGIYHQHAIQLQRHFKRGDFAWTLDSMLVRSSRLRSGLQQVLSSAPEVQYGSER
jgi:hypothetical protein